MPPSRGRSNSVDDELIGLGHNWYVPLLTFAFDVSCTASPLPQVHPQPEPSRRAGAVRGDRPQPPRAPRGRNGAEQDRTLAPADQRLPRDDRALSPPRRAPCRTNHGDRAAHDDAQRRSARDGPHDAERRACPSLHRRASHHGNELRHVLTQPQDDLPALIASRASASSRQVSLSPGTSKYGGPY